MAKKKTKEGSQPKYGQSTLNMDFNLPSVSLDFLKNYDQYSQTVELTLSRRKNRENKE